MRGAVDIERFDLVVVGSGPGGEKGAAQAAYFGKRVALVERAAEVGGASVHTGTLPSKTLRETALYLTGFRRRALYGMSVRLDRKKSLRQLVGRLQEVTERQTRQIRRNLDRHSVALVRGQAVFEDAHTVGVRDAQGDVVRRLWGDVLLIAVGSSPAAPRGIATSDPDVVDSDRILNLDRVPSSMTVVGGGVIGTEYACLFAALGTRITLVEGRDRLLSGTDEELSTSIQLSLERMGAEIILGDAVETIDRDPKAKSDALRLRLKSGRRIRADKLLFSAGRQGNTGGMNLTEVGVRLNDRGHIQVNEHFQTDVPNIYAVGDVIGFPALAATSMEQGRVAMCHAFGIAYKTAMSPYVPYGIYSIPEISTIGPSEQELQARGVAYEVGRARFENNARGQITGDTDGMVKILFDPSSRKLLAAHIIGESATELVHVPMFVMASGGTIDAFIDAVFNFPTLSESFKYAAYDGLQRLAARREAPAGKPARLSRHSPATRRWFVGAALGGKRPAAGEPVTLCRMDRWRRCSFETWAYDAGGEGLRAESADDEGYLVALGGEPAGYAELLAGLKRRGCGMAGEAADVQTDVLLVRTERVWGARATVRKLRGRGDASRRRQRYEMLRSQGLELPAGAAAVSDEQLDAALSALAAYMWATGQAGLVEGTVVV
jgi:NAD(P) transhydrogenase